MNGTKHYIGFGHRARQGKDTAARAIHYAFPRDTHILGFADALKAYARVAFGMLIVADVAPAMIWPGRFH